MEISWRLRAKTILAYPAAVVSLRFPIRERTDIRIDLNKAAAHLRCTSDCFCICNNIFTLLKRDSSSNKCHNQLELNRIRDNNFIVIIHTIEQLLHCFLCNSALVIWMENILLIRVSIMDKCMLNLRGVAFELELIWRTIVFSSGTLRSKNWISRHKNKLGKLPIGQDVVSCYNFDRNWLEKTSSMPFLWSLSLVDESLLDRSWAQSRYKIGIERRSLVRWDIGPWLWGHTWMHAWYWNVHLSLFRSQLWAYPSRELDSTKRKRICMRMRVVVNEILIC